MTKYGQFAVEYDTDGTAVISRDGFNWRVETNGFSLLLFPLSDCCSRFGHKITRYNNPVCEKCVNRFVHGGAFIEPFEDYEAIDESRTLGSIDPLTDFYTLYMGGYEALLFCGELIDALYSVYGYLNGPMEIKRA